MQNKALEYINEEFPYSIRYHEFDEAVVGYAERGRIVYDSNKCIEILMKDNKWDYDDALDFFSYNVAGAYLGETTPLLLWF